MSNATHTPAAPLAQPHPVVARVDTSFAHLPTVVVTVDGREITLSPPQARRLSTELALCVDQLDYHAHLSAGGAA